jgi:hypothetical protein
LDPARYGVIAAGYHRPALPDIPGIEDVETQVAYARLKAGLRPDEPVEMFRFNVEKYV